MHFYIIKLENRHFTAYITILEINNILLQYVWCYIYKVVQQMS